MIKKSLLYILGTQHSMSMCLINTLVNFLTVDKSMYKTVETKMCGQWQRTTVTDLV